LIQRRQSRWAESLANSRKATQLDPGNISFARNVIGTLVAGGRFDEAMAEERRVMALLPQRAEEAAWLPMFNFFASGSTMEWKEWLAQLPAAQVDSPSIRDLRKLWAEILGDLAEFRRLDRLQPYSDQPFFGRKRSEQALAAATFYAANGDRQGARTRLENYPQELRSQLDREPANAPLLSELGMMEAVLGHKEDALRFAQRAVELLPETRDAVFGPNLSMHLAFVYAWTGDKDRAIAELKRLLRAPRIAQPLIQPNVHNLRRNAWFSPLRGDPRFEALLDDPKNNAPLF
jgi:tetratricopeptide (TPR) repeat protein